ncbi:hypothetical protein ACF073_11650 [Streptomyces sp. NPDC015171]|uniref:hypothetical protein n=1 Tax=Streptomyces sp. NPDC015171 TaxID=3364945 RepID=UPI0036F5A518
MRRPAVVLTAALAVLCSACGRTEASRAADSPAPAEAVRAAVAATRHTSAGVGTTLELTAGAGETYHIRTKGSVDMAADTGSLDVRLVEGSSRAEERFLGDEVYVRNTGPQGVDRTWAVAARRTAEAHYLFRAPFNDPEHTLAQVARMRDVRSLGAETVKGVKATRYSGVLDHSTLTMRMAAQTRKKMADFRAGYGGDLPATAEAWVDGRGRLVRARLALKDASTSLATLTLDLSHLGKPVRVTRPSGALPLDTSSGTLLNG